VAACARQLEEDPSGTHHGPTLGRARASAARLVGADPAQIALTPSTSLALLAAADAVPLTAGDNVVTCDLEFVSVVVPWRERCEAAGAELRVVRHREGRIDAEQVVVALDDRTRAVVLSAVQWTSGFRLDLRPIGAACAERGVPFVVDGIQQLGALPLDVREAGISFLACGGHKWLCCPSAVGFVYADPSFTERFRTSLTYAPTAVPPTGDWATAWADPGFDPVASFAHAPDARRFELGVHHGVLGAAALEAALGVLLALDPAVVAAHVVGLAERVADGLTELDLPVVSPRERAHRSGITVFRAGETPADDLALVEFLQARGIVVGARYTSGVGGVRVSTHVYNDEADVDALLAAVAEWRRSRGA
jgi:selenocysteine lyase/cysteine desulfurase